ncbi:MAG: type IV pilus assembly protein PilM [Planctomycetota bacterium]|jgi:type IV pilus assembly protein PilM
MAKMKTVWGVDIGKCALKALKLSESGGDLRVEAFDVIEHPKILSEPDANAAQLIQSALEQFLVRNDVADSGVCVAVPGQSSFTRFVKLPPVETKKIPDIVRFEAEQQIPFAINDVIWRWQTFHDPDSPDVEVGIFAMKRSDINEMLSHFITLGIDVNLVQMAPLALYNFLVYDDQLAQDGATLLADVGADKVDLVIADGARIWTRTIQIGGNGFTEALVRAFKLSFSKAERLKRTAAASKYARQIFQAMRPVFADLVQEIQRSIGYYASLHREVRFRRLIALGNGFRLPGLQKFLEQNLSIPVIRIDNFNNLQAAGAVNSAAFAEQVLSFGVAYGLAVQGLGEAKVSTDLLPAHIGRARRWARKKPWFAAAGVLLLAALGMPLLRGHLDKNALQNSPELSEARAITADLKTLTDDYNNWANQGMDEQKEIEEILELYTNRDYWPSLQNLLLEGMSQARDQHLLSEYANAENKEQQAILEKIQQIKRSERQMIFLESMTAAYSSSLGASDGTSRAPGVDTDSQAKDQESRRGFHIKITARTPLDQAAADVFLRRTFRQCEQLAANYPMLSIEVYYNEIEYLSVTGESTGRRGPARAMGMDMMGFEMGGPAPGAGETPTKAQIEDPLFPDNPVEDIAKDTRFAIRLAVSIEAPPTDDAAETEAEL